MNRSERIGAALLFGLAVCVYAGSLSHGFVYDDFEVIVEQEAPRSVGALLHMFVEPHGLPSSQLPYYRAVPRISLLGQKAIHGDVPALFHAGNVLLIGAAAIAAFALLRLPVFGLPWPLAWLAAALFAVHPVASSVVYPAASGRETLLPALFWLLGTLAHLRGRRGLALASFAVALLGKEQAIALPLVFACADALGMTPDPPGRDLRRWIARYLPALLVIVAYNALRVVILPSGDDVDLLLALRERPAYPLYSMLYGLQVTFSPFAQLVYEPSLAAWWAPRRLALAVSLGLLVLAGVAAQGADARRRLAFWLGFAAASVAFTSNLLPQETLFDERFVFLASLAPAALLAQLALPAWRDARGRTAVAAVGSALVLLAAWATIQRGAAFENGVAFGRQWVRSNPAHANARFTLGTALAREGSAEEALPELEEAVRLAPSYVTARYNLAAVLAGLGRLPAAAAQLEILARLSPADPEPHRMLAVIYQRLGQDAEARAQSRAANALETQRLQR